MSHTFEFKYCTAPHPIENLQIEQIRISENSFNLNVTWDGSDWRPDYYQVSFQSLGNDDEEEIKTIKLDGVSIDSVHIF